MIKELRVPEISENVESGEVLNVLVKPGDMVELGQAIAELETEKAAFEVPSTYDGKITEILIKEGDKVDVGQVIAKIDPEGKAQTKEEEPAAEEEKPKNEETKVQEKPKEEKKPKEQKEPQKKAAEPVEGEEEPPQKASEKKSEIGVAAAPSVRQLARELGIDIEQVRGTAVGGRISPEDVKRYAREIITGKGGATQTPEGRPPRRGLPDFEQWGPVERKHASPTRRKTAETMSAAWEQAVHVTQCEDADITLLQEFIREYAPTVEKGGGKLTITAVVLKAIAMGLKDYETLNASYDGQAEEIVYKRYYHVSVAVDTDRGLLVPVVRDVDKKSILQLSVELGELAKKAREHKISMDEMAGGSFTLTNLGGIGGTYFTPIIFWPQAAILGVSRAVVRPVYSEDKFEPRWVMPLSLSYDHRIVDGATGLRFLRRVAEILENPFELALQECS